MNVFKILGAIFLVVVAIALHLFYVSYEINTKKDTIATWPATPGAHDQFLKAVARHRVRPALTKTIKTPSLEQIAAMQDAHYEKYCRLKPRRNWAHMDRSQRINYMFNTRNYNCSKPWVSPHQRSSVITVRPATNYEQGLVWAEQHVPASRIGMVASVVSAGPKASRTATAHSLWLGILVPLVLLFGAICLVQWAWRARKLQPALATAAPALSSAPPAPAPVAQRTPPPSGANPAPPSLVDVLRAHFGPDLAVAQGSATKQDPLVITDPVDYVSVEYIVAKFLMAGEQYKLETQTLKRQGDRKIDELVFNTRTPGTPEWEATRTFYFDITMGFNRRKNGARCT